jgi:tRNA G18 (ribose-2'-O)-methylase SpoU
VPQFAPIATRDDPRFEPYRDLRDRDVRGRDGVFIVEGEVLLRVLVARDPEAIVSVLILDKRREKLDDALAGLPSSTPVYLAPEPVMNDVVGFPIHRGVLALARRRTPRSAASLLGATEGPSLVVGIAGVTNHDNVGGIFRNAAAFGAKAVIFDHATCDPLYRKALRVSVGAALAVPFASVANEDEVIDCLEGAGFVPYALTPRGEIDLHALRSSDLPNRLALVLGAEGMGLSERTLKRTRGLRITMAPGWDSLNVSVASGVVLHALSPTR